MQSIVYYIYVHLILNLSKITLKIKYCVCVSVCIYVWMGSREYSDRLFDNTIRITRLRVSDRRMLSRVQTDWDADLLGLRRPNRHPGLSKTGKYRPLMARRMSMGARTGTVEVLSGQQDDLPEELPLDEGAAAEGAGGRDACEASAQIGRWPGCWSSEESQEELPLDEGAGAEGERSDLSSEVEEASAQIGWGPGGQSLEESQEGLPLDQGEAKEDDSREANEASARISQRPGSQSFKEGRPGQPVRLESAVLLGGWEDPGGVLLLHETGFPTTALMQDPSIDDGLGWSIIADDRSVDLIFSSHAWSHETCGSMQPGFFTFDWYLKIHYNRNNSGL